MPSVNFKSLEITLMSRAAMEMLLQRSTGMSFPNSQSLKETIITSTKRTLCQSECSLLDGLTSRNRTCLMGTRFQHFQIQLCLISHRTPKGGNLSSQIMRGRPQLYNLQIIGSRLVMILMSRAHFLRTNTKCEWARD